MSTILLIGAGAGTPEALTVEAAQAIRGAKRVLATPRLAHALASLNPQIQSMAVAEILPDLEQDRGDTAVVVSGDVGFYSLAGRIRERFGKSRTVREISGVSSLQMLCARAGVGYEQVRLLSAHGRETPVLGPVSYNRRVFLLTGGGQDAARILRELSDAGLGEVSVWAGQRLGMPDEAVISGTAGALAGTGFAEPVCLLLENPHPAPLHTRLRDGEFLRGGVPMTKEPVRVLASQRLEVAPGDVVYDIGAGTGSVSVALARLAHEGLVYAIERNAQGLELIRRNRQKFGTHNLLAVEGEAPEALEALPPADKVFIGGSGGKLAEIIGALGRQGREQQVCITAVTLESLGQGVRVLEQEGFLQVEVDCVNVAAAVLRGGYHMMQANNPVYLISGRRSVS